MVCYTSLLAKLLFVLLGNVKEVLEELVMQMDNLRNNKTVPYLNPYKGIDDCIELVQRKIKQLANESNKGSNQKTT